MRFLIISLLFLLPWQSQAQESVRTLVAEGVVLHDAGDYDGALALYEQAYKLDPTYVTTMYEMGFTYHAMGDYKKAQKWMKKVIKLNDLYVGDAYSMLGSSQDDMGKPKKAIKTFQKGLALFPDDNMLYFNLALTHSRLEEWNEVAANLEEGILLDPSHASSLLLMATAQEILGNKSKALMSAYWFLILEPNTSRSAAAVALTKRVILPDMEADEDSNLNLTLVMNDDKEFATADMVLGMVAFSLYNETKGKISVPELFVGINESFFKILDENKEDKIGLWWEGFGYIFISLEKAGHTEAFSHYIWQSEGGQIAQWIESHDAQMDAFFNWIDNL
ncbi:MAG: tetratricopeptide repeat protein [Saprospiraceae bacterium]|nr:tetratricopeptide repeat protein [Saprospiraceae bacterium]